MREAVLSDKGSNMLPNSPISEQISQKSVLVTSRAMLEHYPLAGVENVSLEASVPVVRHS